MSKKGPEPSKMVHFGVLLVTPYSLPNCVNHFGNTYAIILGGLRIGLCFHNGFAIGVGKGSPKGVKMGVSSNETQFSFLRIAGLT